ncbi:MAG: hypothetical protein WKG07_27575 [Hymenobacter sp.]
MNNEGEVTIEADKAKYAARRNGQPAAENALRRPRARHRGARQGARAIST